MAELIKDIRKRVKEIMGEQNLYKINRWKYPDKLCKHNNSVYCDRCAEEIRKEKVFL